ncbi:ATP-binding protein [Cognatishimia sp. F0-27]|uniref:ATP-binding protein n=1 Tax=Cognatishimia sp. F0-27 TaxID=2816855 RepID=UPI001D0CDADD|nr:ATP-binding protein [Cognatishimia sp. F0-27]MCC1494605.1 response regulator [Cognatishimia sp. F0-27]
MSFSTEFPLRVRQYFQERGTVAPLIRELRALEPPTDPALLLQIGLILLVSFVGAFTLGIWQAAIWSVAYVASQLVEKWIVRVVPEDASRAQFYLVLLVLLAESSIYCFMPLFLWFYESEVAKFGAVALMTASAMHTTLNRAAFPSIMACFMVPNAAVFVFIGFWEMTPVGLQAGAVVYPVIGVAVAIFFVVMFLQAHRKELSNRRTQEALKQSQKLETIGKLTGGIAHDFNNLISVVSGNLQLIFETENLRDVRHYAETAKDAADACADLTAKMLAFGRKAPLQPVAISVDTLCRNLSEFTDRLVAKNIEIRFEIEPDTRPVYVDAYMFQNALLNLVINASDAMPQGGLVTVSASNCGQNTVVFSVVDTGPGIEPENLEKIFDPFFSTKEHLGRSGLGLSMVQGFVEQSNGAIDVWSKPGEGTRFLLTLPAAKTESAPRLEGPEPVTHSAPVEGKCIMLVDDNEQLLKAISIKMMRDGYKVVCHVSGDDAAAALAQDAAPDLLITDAVMPGLVQGPDLIEILYMKDRAVPAILMSGYAEPSLARKVRLGEPDRFMSKPIDLATLSSTVAELLRERSVPVSPRTEQRNMPL